MDLIYIQSNTKTSPRLKISVVKFLRCNNPIFISLYYFFAAPPLHCLSSSSPSKIAGTTAPATTHLRLNTKIYNAAARCFRSQSTNSTPSPAKYDELINDAGRRGDFAAVRDLLSERLRAGVLNTSKTFRFIATTTVALDELLQSLAALDGWFPRKHAHDTLAAQLARLHRTDDALRVAETMARGDYGPTAVTFEPIVNALARKKEMAAAWRAVDAMRACGVTPSAAAYNHILTAYCFVGDVASAADTVEKMEAEGIEADAVTYDALVLGACRAGRVEAALAVVRRAAEDGVPALFSMYTHIIGEMVRCEYYEQALEFVRILSGVNEKLDEEIYGYLVRRFKYKKRIAEAKLVAEEMERRGLPIGESLQTVQAEVVED